MSKNYFLFKTLILLLIVSCNSNKISDFEFSIKGKATGVVDGVRVYLKMSENGQKGRVTDTAIVSNGYFEFKGTIEAPEMRILTIDGVLGQSALVLESGEITANIFKDSIQKSEIIGGKNNSIFTKYKEGYQNLVTNMNDLRQEYMTNRNNPVIVKELQSKNLILREKMKNFGLDFLIDNPNSDFSLMLLDGVTAQKGFDVDLAKLVLESMSQDLLNKESNKLIVQNIKQKIRTASKSDGLNIGSKVPNFSAPTPTGEMITLDEILGKVTILDFWASWCKPCRVENPNFVKLYDEYHEKGLEIISVSLDRSDQKQRWIDAIEKDRLSWYNVSNLKFWRDPVAQLYNISSIPATFILDDKGKLIASRLRGAELVNKIEALLGN
ncbi:MAG: peroxiredoxin [Flavobacteriaceae bacterium]|nr:peroxiredoxin [Flavobacteriaceae bacterium]|tara:strand:- start:87281 stop:88426 length:1146 start_codon:yes stop_codon:yes gene_type:complete